MNKSENQLFNPENLLTGTTGSLSDLYAQALTEGLIPDDMSLEEFVTTTKANRENPPRILNHFSEDLKNELTQSKRNVANIMKKK